MRTHIFRINKWLFAGIGATVAGVVLAHMLERPAGTSVARAEPATVTIDQPGDASGVPARPVVSGTVSSTQVEVWLIVHALETAEYWVQPVVSVDEDGTWRTQAYIGDGTSSGKLFELAAVADPASALTEGDVLADWPAAVSRSRVILVSRR